DYSAAALELAAQKLALINRRDPRPRDVRFVHASIGSLALPENSFDRVLMSELIEHLAAAEAAQLLRKIRVALRPTGTLLVFTYPNRLARRFYWLKRWLYAIARRQWLP